MRIGLIQQQPVEPLLQKAIELDILDKKEAELVKLAYEATLNAVRVDEFTKEGWKLA